MGIRAFHFILRGSATSTANINSMIDEAALRSFNTVIVQLTDGIILNTMPWTPLASAWTKQQFIDFVAYAKARNIQVIPEFQLLTHQERFFGTNRPDLMYNVETYDPRIAEVYDEYVYPMIDEVLAITGSYAFNIAHDELKINVPVGETVLPANLFVQDILKLHTYLTSKGIETWMWGDMLMHPDEFTTMYPEYFNGDAAGYGKSVRDQLPRSITILDWHYRNPDKLFPSIAMLAAEGFCTIGASHDKAPAADNFSAYTKANGGRGMIATTWSFVQQNDFVTVYEILGFSGQYFLRDFR